MYSSRAFPAFRRQLSVAMSVAVVGSLCVVSPASAQTPLLRGGLKAGPHAVGFRLEYKLVLTGDTSGAEQAYRNARGLLPDDNTVGGFRP